MLDEYRRSFGEAYESVVRTIRNALNLKPAGRPAKSTSSIVEKLRRETIRLTQMQDIAGCRVVVTDVAEQDRVVQSLRAAFPAVSVMDRRSEPSYGYRAVHVIPTLCEKLVEIQIRTELQHLWAELSEKLSDIVDPTVKYGGGDDKTRTMLTVTSETIAEIESLERKIEGSKRKLTELQDDGARAQLRDMLEKPARKLRELRAGLSRVMKDVIVRLKR